MINLDLKKFFSSIKQEIESFFSKIKRAFSKTPPPELQKVDELESLKGRIKTDIRNNAKKVMEQLNDVEEILQQETEMEVHPIIHNVIFEMKKDIQKILDQPFLGKGKDIQDKVVKYKNWMEKVLLFKQTQDQKLLQEACIPYLIEKAIESLESDLKLIKGYQEHRLHSIEEEDRAQLEMSLQQAVGSYFKEIFGDHLDSISYFRGGESVDIHEVHEWKMGFDERRQKYLDGIYPAIDEIINSPAREFVEDEETFFNVSSRILKFEFNAARILKELQKELSRGERKELKGRIEGLQDEIQHLQSDLHIPQSHIDRIESVMESILKLHPEEE